MVRTSDLILLVGIGVASFIVFRNPNVRNLFFDAESRGDGGGNFEGPDPTGTVAVFTLPTGIDSPEEIRSQGFEWREEMFVHGEQVRPATPEEVRPIPNFEGGPQYTFGGLVKSDTFRVRDFINGGEVYVNWSWIANEFARNNILNIDTKTVQAIINHRGIPPFCPELGPC